MRWQAARRSPTMRRCARRSIFWRLSAGPVSFTQFSALLRSPELQESAAEAGEASLLDVALRSRAPSEVPLAGWLELAQGTARAASTWAGRRLAAPAGACTDPRRAARQSSDEPVGFALDHAHSKRPVDACAIGGRAASINRPSGFANCWRRLRRRSGCSARHSRRSAESILRRAARDTAFQDADRRSRRSGSAGN